VPPRNRARTGKIYWKPSISEEKDGLFLQVKISDDIEAAKQAKLNFMYKKGLTVQPYIIIVGSVSNVHTFYVVMNNKNYQISTF